MCSERDKYVINMILNPILPFAFAEKEENGDREAFAQLPQYHESELANVEGVEQAEKGSNEHALAKFAQAIQLCPRNPSTYNNRAQLHRLMSNLPEAMRDLETALELSAGRGRCAAQSHVQMALIYKLEGDDTKAKDEFEKAAKLGSNFAKNQLVAMNPYAAMCNKMLGEVMTKFRKAD